MWLKTKCNTAELMEKQMNEGHFQVEGSNQENPEKL